jgi:hypothetical protein
MKNWQAFILLGTVSFLIKYCSTEVGLFWDNVLFAGKISNWLYENRTFHWNLPDELDTGHPPLLATYLVIFWHLIGKSLATTHWLLFPFVWGLLYQLYLFVDYFFAGEKTEKWWAFLLVVADATLLSQFVLVTPEIIQLFLFFTAINALLRQNKLILACALAGLSLVSYRGMVFASSIFLIDFSLYCSNRDAHFLRFFSVQKILVYGVSVLPAVSYLLFRMANKGWIRSNPSGHWVDAWGFASFSDFMINFLKNNVILWQRMADFGRIFIIVAILLLLYQNRYLFQKKNVNTLFILWLGATLPIAILSVLIVNPMGHRYFIPSYLIAALLFFVLLQHISSKKIVYAIALTVLLLGNFIVYPDKMAQGWDASLAHLPYWKLRKEAIIYLEQQQIELEQVATFFPNYTTIDNVELNGDRRSFSKFSGKEKYVFYSNVYNLSDNEFDKLYNNYELVKTFRIAFIRVEIWKRKHPSND